MRRSLRRTASRLRWDLVLQVRQGFLLAGVVVAGTWIAIAARWVDPGFASWSPAFALGNLSITSFYFVAGLLLLERVEGSLQAIWLSPLRPAEYLASKVTSLALFAVVETCVILAACFGAALSWAPMVAGMLAMSALYTLFGILVVLRYRGISEFILPSALYLAILEIPVLHALGLWESPLLWLHPLQPPMLVMEWAVTPERVGATGLALGTLGSLAWIALLGWACARALGRFAAGTSTSHPAHPAAGAPAGAAP